MGTTVIQTIVSEEWEKIVKENQQYKQQIDELISYCYDGIFSQNESIELLSDKSNADIHIGKISAYKEILSKLKEVKK